MLMETLVRMQLVSVAPTTLGIFWRAMALHEVSTAVSWLSIVRYELFVLELTVPIVFGPRVHHREGAQSLPRLQLYIMHPASS